MTGFDDSKVDPEVLEVVAERPYDPEHEVPHDPESGVFAGTSAADQAFGGFEFPRIRDAIAIPEVEDETPAIGELLKDEAKALVEIVSDFGLPNENVNRLITFFDRPDLFNFTSGPIGEHGQIGNGEEITVNPATGETTIYIAPNVVRNFATDATHAIFPVGGDKEIAFARDTGVKMAGTYALSMLCVEVLRRQTAYADPELVADLFDTGHEDLPGLDEEMYTSFLPYRLAARLAITRLARLVTVHYGFEDGIEVAQEYSKLRQRAFDAVQRASYGPYSFDDMGTAYPLSEESAEAFMQKLPNVTKLYSVPTE